MTPAELHSRLAAAGRGAVLRHARLPLAMAPPGLPAAGDGLVAADIWLARGRVDAVAERGRPGDGRGEIDLAGALVWALPVDCHAHVDKGQTWARSANPDGSFTGALEVGEQESLHHFSAKDMCARASFILDCALAHGTSAIRSHVDANQRSFDAAFAVMSELAQDYRDRLHLQLAPFTGIGEDPAFVTQVAQAARAADSGVLSVYLRSDPQLETFLDLIFGLAMRHGLSLDFHADETLDPDSHCLRAVARAALRHRADMPILVGHACALSVQDPASLDETLDLVREAGIGIVALPLCNAYLQDRRPDASPRLRAIAPLREIVARGIPVAIASDNVRDPFHAYGDMDLPEVYRQATLLMHLDHPVADWPATVSSAAADLIGRPDLGRLRDGGPADLMIFPARNWSEFCARPAARRVLLRGGVMQSTEPPAFARLDGLEAMAI